MGKENELMNGSALNDDQEVLPPCLQRYLDLIAEEEWLNSNYDRYILISDRGELVGIVDSIEMVQLMLSALSGEYFCKQIGSPMEVVEAPNLLEIVEE